MKRGPWLVVGLLFVLQVINYLDRQTLSILAPTLRQQLGFSTHEYSYIVSAFLAAYTIGFGLGGHLLDRFGVKPVLAVAVGMWSVAGSLHAAVRGWVGLAVCRFLLGLGESLGPPGGAKAIGEWMPPRQRALSMGIFSNGLITGAILAPPLVAFLTLRFGWQSAFLVTGCAGFFWLVVWLRIYRSPPSAAAPDTVPLWTVLNDRRTLVLALARFLTDPVPYFFTFWLPEFLTHERGFSLSEIGALGWLPFLGADIGGILGGAVSDLLVRRGFSVREARSRMLLGAALLTPAAFVAVRTGSAVLTLLLIGVVLAAHSCWTVNLQTMMTEGFPPGQVGKVLGISGMGSGLGGIAATLIAGRLIATQGYVPVFSILAGLHLSAYLLLRVVERTERSSTR